MTLTDYGLMAASAAAILLVAAYWWRRAPEAVRIYVTELGWYMGSLWAAMYVWIRARRPTAPSAWRLIGTLALAGYLERCPSADRHSPVDGPRGGRGAAP